MKSKLSAFFLLLLLSISLIGVAQSVEIDDRTDINATNNYDEDVRNQGNLLPLEVVSIKIDGDEIPNGDDIRTELDRNNVIDVSVKVLANEDVSDVEILSYISGYEYNDRNRISDSSGTFDLHANTTKTFHLSITLPANMDKDDRYKLRVVVSDRDHASRTYNYNLYIDTVKHDVAVKDVQFSPANEVKAGRAFLTVVRLKNYGDKDETDGVKVTVSVPELGLSASDWLDEIESDDSVSTEELYLRIPDCAEKGIYDVYVVAEFNDGYDSIEEEYSIKVVESDTCDVSGDDTTDDTKTEDKTIITIGTEAQDVTVGQGGVVYPVSLTNAGKSTKTYTVEIAGASEWADTKVSPSNVAVVSSGDTETLFVYVTAKDAASQGLKMFSVTVKSNNEVLKQVPLSANVKGSTTSSDDGSWDKIKKGLEIGLVVLVVLLVIIGLIIGFSKMKESDDEEDFDTETQTYY